MFIATLILFTAVAVLLCLGYIAKCLEERDDWFDDDDDD